MFTNKELELIKLYCKERLIEIDEIEGDSNEPELREEIMLAISIVAKCDEINESIAQ